MADERRFFAGDLGSDHLTHVVEVESPDVEVAGILEEVTHARSATPARTPITLIRLRQTDLNPSLLPTYVLDPNWPVVVR